MGRRTVAVIEDEPEIRNTYKSLLEESGFNVLAYSSKNTFLSDLPKEGSGLEIVVVDRGLPEVDGLDIVRTARNDFPELTIIVATGRDRPEDIREGLEAGADDYLAKPIDLMHFVLKIKNAFKKIDAFRTPDSSWVLDADQRVLKNSQSTVKLTQRELQIFQPMFERKGSILRRDHLITQMGIEDEDQARNLDVHINALRKKLKDTGFEISTIRSVGYRLDFLEV